MLPKWRVYRLYKLQTVDFTNAWTATALQAEDVAIYTSLQRPYINNYRLASLEIYSSRSSRPAVHASVEVWTQ